MRAPPGRGGMAGTISTALARQLDGGSLYSSPALAKQLDCARYAADHVHFGFSARWLHSFAAQ